MQLDLENFLPFVQLAAGLNIAFVAVEIANGYTRILSDKVFNVSSILTSEFQSLKDNIGYNRTSLNNMNDIDIGGKNTRNRIEYIKRQYEKLEANIGNSETVLLKTAGEKCSFQSFSGLSLMMFLYCCTLLLMAPFKPDSFLLTTTFIITLYSVIAWKSKDSKIHCKLNYVVYSYLVCMILAIFSYVILKKYGVVARFKDAIIIWASVLPILNFIIFYYKIYSYIHQMKTDINKERKMLQSKLSEINEDLKELQNASTLSMKL